MIVCVYVNDLLYIGNNEKLFAQFKQDMFQEFEMTNNGLMSYVLGNQVQQRRDGIYLSQEKYIKELLEKFRMSNYGTVNTLVVTNYKLSREWEGEEVNALQYKSLIESLRYLTITRQNIVYGVSLLSRYMETPRETHWQAGKRILRYVKGSMNLGLRYVYGERFELIGYSDSDLGRDPIERKSTIGYVFFGASTTFSWTSKKKSIVALSSCETEYIALVSTVCDIIWLKNLLDSLKHLQKATTVLVDNMSTIKLAKNPVQHEMSKHINTRFHFIRDHVK